MVSLKRSTSSCLVAGSQIRSSYNENLHVLYLYALSKFVTPFQQPKILGLIINTIDLTNPNCLHRINQELTLSYHFLSPCFLSLQTLSAIQKDDGAIDGPLATKQAA